MKKTKMFFLLFIEIELDVFITYIFRWLNILNNYTIKKNKRFLAFGNWLCFANKWLDLEEIRKTKKA
jgi:hypothetical protein